MSVGRLFLKVAGKWLLVLKVFFIRSEMSKLRERGRQHFRAAVIYSCRVGRKKRHQMTKVRVSVYLRGVQFIARISKSVFKPSSFIFSIIELLLSSLLGILRCFHFALHFLNLTKINKIRMTQILKTFNFNTSPDISPGFITGFNPTKDPWEGGVGRGWGLAGLEENRRWARGVKEGGGGRDVGKKLTSLTKVERSN